MVVGGTSCTRSVKIGARGRKSARRRKVLVTEVPYIIEPCLLS